MKIAILFSLSFFFFNSFVNAQGISGYTINMGLGYKAYYPSNNDLTFKHQPLLAGNLGVFFEKEIGEKIFIGFELLFVQMNGKFKQVEKTVVAPYTYITTYKRSTFSTYFGAPFYVQFKTSRLGLYIGIQPAWLIYGLSVFETIDDISKNKQQVEHIEQKRSPSSHLFNTKVVLDLGPKIGIDVRLNKRLSIRADFHYGKYSYYVFDRFRSHNRQVTLGLKYYVEKK